MKSRRSFIKKSMMALSAGSLITPSLLHAEPIDSFKELPSLKERKVLFTYGGWKGHEPEKFRDYMVPWLKDEGANVIVSESLDPYANEELMDTIDLIIQIHTMSSITEEQQKGLLDAVKNGTGMAGWHGGMGDAFRNNPAYQYMVGGQWVAHPGGIVDYTVQITNHKDEITADLKDFSMNSEQYYMHVDPNVKVLATTKFSGDHDYWIDGAVLPVVWKKMHDKGRVFYTSLGHNLDHVTGVPEAISIIKRGIRWASASKYEGVEKWVSPVY